MNRAVVWSVAGSDSGAGAGLQADLKAFEAFGVHGCTAVAALTAQNSVDVRAIEPVSPSFLEAQLAALDDDMPPAALKTGMLGSVANLRVVAQCIDRLRRRDPGVKLVVDPVLRASTGAALADGELLDAYRRELLPRASLITPNRREAAALLGLPLLRSRADVEQAGHALREAGAAAVAITGGDDGGDYSEDWVDAPWARGWLSLPRVATAHDHGTGCTFASSAAAALALGFVAVEAVVLAKMATTEALRNGYAAGRGAGPVRVREGFAGKVENLPRMTLGCGAGAGLPQPAKFAKPSERIGLYAIVDSAAWVERVLRAGVRTVQLRIKGAAHPRLREEIRAAVAAARASQAQLFVNDHWQLAIEEGAYGVHLGQEDVATADLDAIARAGLRLGISTHAFWEVARAWAVQPSYIACGPIHPTAAKSMPWIPQGNANLAFWCGLLPLPVVAIGGMDVVRATHASACGADGVAVISAITAAASPETAMAELRRALDQPVGAPKVPPVPLPQSTLRS